MVSRDPDQKFELALELKKLGASRELLEQIRKEDKDSVDTQQKWRKLGDLVRTTRMSGGPVMIKMGMMMMIIMVPMMLMTTPSGLPGGCYHHDDHIMAMTP